MSKTLGIVQRLEEVEAMLRTRTDHHDADAACDVRQGAAELRRLHALLNTPHTADFVQAVAIEAAHQRERWGANSDAGKEDSDWFWLLGYLGGKALNSSKAYEASDCSDTKAHEKSLHHIITTAAACLNWHAARSFVSNGMRPGIELLLRRANVDRRLHVGVMSIAAAVALEQMGIKLPPLTTQTKDPEPEPMPELEALPPPMKREQLRRLRQEQRLAEKRAQQSRRGT